MTQAIEAVRAAIDRYGLLLMQDASAPSMMSIIAGEPVKGSWWSHPRNQLMFDVLQVISAETLVVKLLAGKRTFVHPRSWPAVCAGHGHHARVLQTWPRWREQTDIASLPGITEARNLLAAATAKYMPAATKTRLLPWPT